MIALTVSAAAYEASPADWDFSTIGNTEGWTANDSVQEMFVQDGNLCIHIHGDSPAKSFADMTGNNVNHPNDFLARWYAQYIVGMLKDSTFSSDRPLNARRLFSFENGVQGWSAGENVSTVNTVRSFANWPFAPQEGSCALEAEFPTQEANAWRTIMISLEEPLNLSEAGCVYYHINSYGGSGGTGYETRIRLYSGSNMKEEIKAMQADSWNYICTDVASWPYKDNITKIEIAFRATGSTAAWYGSRFQIDNVGYLLEGTLLYDFEGTTHSWMGTENVMSVNSVAAFANSPMKPAMLQRAFIYPGFRTAERRRRKE